MSAIQMGNKHRGVEGSHIDIANYPVQVEIVSSVYSIRLWIVRLYHVGIAKTVTASW